jgi:hypothetical protein
MIGYGAGQAHTNVNENTLIGSGVGMDMKGHNQVMLGYKAGYTTSGYEPFSVNQIVYLGSEAGHNFAGSGNIAIGRRAGYSATVRYSGVTNIMIGSSVIPTAVDTSFNFLVGTGSSSRYLLSGDFTTAGQAKLGINISNDIPTATLEMHSGGDTSSDDVIHIEDSSNNTLFHMTGDGAIVLKLAGLPTSDPSNSGEIWNDSGTLKISL